MSAIKRTDGRKFDELRDIEIKLKVIKNAKGSAMFRIGKTTAIAGVYGPKDLYPKHLQNPKKGKIRIYYDLMSFSVSERKKPGPSKRSTELDMVIRDALESVVMLDKFPKLVVDIFIEIPQADAGTRCASICAASLALADAGIPMKDLISAVSAGKLGKDIVLDINKEEEDWKEGATDIPVAYSQALGKVLLLQLDGNISPEELDKAVKLGIEGCKRITELQRKAIKEFYK